ncbi:MAG: HAMP domain-containing protein [Candidatus Omnitrophota bacterium]
MRIKIIWKFLSAYIFFTLIAVFVLNFFVSSKIQDYYEEKISDKLVSNLSLARDILKESLNEGDAKAVQEKTASLAETLRLRVTVIDAKGKVLGDSEKRPELMENHMDRQEVIAAIEGGLGQSSRYSETLDFYMKYVAIPVEYNAKTLGVIRLAVPLTEVEHELNVIRRVFILGGVLAVVITLILGYFISRNISLPIRKMESTANSIAEGDFSKRVDIKTKDELEGLANSFNQMADELQRKMDNLRKMDQIRTDFVANVSHEQNSSYFN